MTGFEVCGRNKRRSRVTLCRSLRLRGFPVELRFHPWLVNALEGEELKVVVFVEPRAFEVLQRKASPSAEREGVDGELDVCVLFFSSLGFVVEDVQVPVTDLQEVNVAGDQIGVEVEIEAAPTEIPDIVASEVDRYFYRYGDRIVDKHEALKRFVPFFIRWGCG